MNKTKIEWVCNPDGTPGYTWNPITSCLNHVNGMCKGGNFPCYAYRLADYRLKTIYLANKNTATKDYDEDSYPFYPRFWPERLYDPYAGKSALGKPKGIFVCDMSDLFGIGIPEEWTRKILHVCKMASQHRFYLLTKQPQNLAKFSPFPNNCYVGVTITSSSQRILHHMVKVEAKIKFISFEPLLYWDVDMGSLAKAFETAGINWLIIGAQTKPYKPPKIEWVEEIVKAADKADIPVFLKDNLKPLLATKEVFGDKYIPLPLGDEHGELRQEMPK